MIRSIVLMLVAAGIVAAQPVQVPRAQGVIDGLLRRHAEVQTIGLHITPPGETDNVNIACSKLGKVGKKSADVDMGVIATGKPSMRRAAKGAFDMGVPLADSAGRPLGMLVIVLPEPVGKNEAEALRQGLTLRDEVAREIPDKAWLFVGATVVRSPIVMVAETPLPKVNGAFGHLAADVEGDRLFVAAQGNGSVEVFDLAGEYKRSIPGFQAPRGLAWAVGSGELFVVDGGASEVVVLGGPDLRVISRIALKEGAGESLYDSKAGRLYVAGDGVISTVGTAEKALLGEIAVGPGEIGGMAMAEGRVWASVGESVLILKGKTVEARIEGIHGGPVAADVSGRRLFVAGGGKLQVLDLGTRRVTGTYPCITGAEGVNFDSAGNRVFVSGANGLTIFIEQGRGLVWESEFGTKAGKTSLWLAGKNLFYTVHGKTAEDIAGLQVYGVR